MGKQGCTNTFVIALASLTGWLLCKEFFCLSLALLLFVNLECHKLCEMLPRTARVLNLLFFVPYLEHSHLKTISIPQLFFLSSDVSFSFGRQHVTGLCCLPSRIAVNLDFCCSILFLRLLLSFAGNPRVRLRSTEIQPTCDCRSGRRTL